VTEKILRVNPPGLPDSAGIGYSQISIVEAGRTAYVSGQVAVSSDGAPVPESLTGQTKIVIKNLRSALDAIGAAPSDIAIMRIFVVDLCPERLEQSFALLLEMLNGAKPSITGVGVAALASPEFQIEVEMTVRAPD